MTCDNDVVVGAPSEVANAPSDSTSEIAAADRSEATNEAITPSDQTNEIAAADRPAGTPSDGTNAANTPSDGHERDRRHRSLSRRTEGRELTRAGAEGM